MASDKKIFAIFAVSSPSSLTTILASEFPETHLAVGEGQWFVVGPSTMTTAELALKLKISADPSASNGVIVSVSSYFGRAPLNIWEWLAAKAGDQSAVAG